MPLLVDCAAVGSTHCVEALDVADVLVDKELHLLWHVSHAGAAWTRYKRHVCDWCWTVERRHFAMEERIDVWD